MKTTSKKIKKNINLFSIPLKFRGKPFLGLAQLSNILLKLKTYCFSTQSTIYLIITNTQKMLEICRQDIVFWAHGVYHGDLHHVGVVGDGHVGADPSVLQDASFGGVWLCWVAPPSQWVGRLATTEGQQHLPELEVLKQKQYYYNCLFNFCTKNALDVGNCTVRRTPPIQVPIHLIIA